MRSRVRTATRARTCMKRGVAIGNRWPAPPGSMTGGSGEDDRFAQALARDVAIRRAAAGQRVLRHCGSALRGEVRWSSLRLRNRRCMMSTLVLRQRECRPCRHRRRRIPSCSQPPSGRRPDRRSNSQSLPQPSPQPSGDSSCDHAAPSLQPPTPGRPASAEDR